MEEKSGVDDSKHPENPDKVKKGVRRRKKLLITKIRVQLEFYFSASNLSKDKFMNELLERDPFIDLEIFFRFNKIRSMTDNIDLLKNAVEKSPILTLSEDGKKVKRLTPFKTKGKEMETLCTIYVENIPSHVDHEWVHDAFVKYGTIDYISFPRFKSTGRPKGFAFVEFETPEMANVALKCFGAEGCTIPDSTEPSKLTSICTHETAESMSEIDSHSVNQMENQLVCVKKVTNTMQCELEESDEKKNAYTSNVEGKGVSGKRKREDCEDHVDVNVETDASIDSVQKKKKNICKDQSLKGSSLQKECVHETEDEARAPKISEQDLEISEDCKVKENVEVSSEIKDTSNIEDIIREVRKEVDEEKGLETKSTDQIKSILSSKKRSLDGSEEGSPTKAKKHRVSFDTSGISSTMKNISDFAEDSSSAEYKKKKRRKRNRKSKGECLEGISLKVMSKQQWTRLRNHYLNMQKMHMENLKWDLQKKKYVPAELLQPPVTKASSKGKPQFIPDAIIKVSFEEPPQDPKKLQETIHEGGRGGVAYVETSAVEKDVYIRFVSAEAAAAYLKTGLWSRMVLLSGEKEKEYWNHLHESWLMRRAKKNKGMKGTSSDIPNKLRGREKLLQKALKEAQNYKPNSYIVFEDK